MTTTDNEVSLSLGVLTFLNPEKHGTSMCYHYPSMLNEVESSKTGYWKVDLSKLNVNSQLPVCVGVHYALKTKDSPQNSNRIVVIDTVFKHIIATYEAPIDQSVSDFFDQLQAAYSHFRAEYIGFEYNDDALCHYCTRTGFNPKLVPASWKSKEYEKLGALVALIKCSTQAEQLRQRGENINRWQEINLPLTTAYLSAIWPGI